MVAGHRYPAVEQISVGLPRWHFVDLTQLVVHPYGD